MGDLGEPAGKIVALVLTVCVATGSHYLVEQRFLRRKWKLARVASHDLSLAEAEHRASKLSAGIVAARYQNRLPRLGVGVARRVNRGPGVYATCPTGRSRLRAEAGAPG